MSALPLNKRKDLNTHRRNRVVEKLYLLCEFLLLLLLSGDLFQKPYISGSADSASFDLTGAEDYVLLACDGFFDAIRPFEVVDLVLEHLIQNKGNGLKAAERLVAAAKESGSTDNITVLVAFLREPRDVLADCLEDPKGCPADDCAAEPVFSFVRSEANN